MDNSAKSSPQPLLEPDPELWHDFNDLLGDPWVSSVLYDEPAIQSETNESKLKRNSPSDTDNIIRKKRLSDHKYRQKRKEEIIKNKEELDNLRKKLSRLAEENETLKMEVLDKTKTLQYLEEINRLLMQSSHQEKTENCSAGDVDLRRENAELKKQIDDLLKSMNNPSKLEILKLERERAESEREMRVLKVIVEALCDKINQHETHQGQQNLLW